MNKFEDFSEYGSMMRIKVDIKKAYESDSVDRNFIIHMSYQKRFSDKMITIIKGMISTASFSALHNVISRSFF